MKRIALNIFMILIIGITLTGFKVVDDNKPLFSIGRSKDANEIIYSLNLEKGNKLNLHDPIQVFWLKRTENNNQVPLTWIQQRFSYGLVYLKKNDSYAKFHFAGYSGRIFELKKDRNGNFHIYTLAEGKKVILNRIYIHISGGTFWLPEIPKVELFAELADNGKNIIEIIKT